jgi:hypothetical protein
MMVWPLAQFTVFMVFFLFILPYWQYRKGKAKTPPQLSMKRLLFLVTLFAFLIGTLHAVEQRYERRKRENNERHQKAQLENQQRYKQAMLESQQRLEQALFEIKERSEKRLRENAVTSLNRRFELLEGRRDRLDAQEYERRLSELEAEATRLEVTLKQTPDA